MDDQNQYTSTTVNPVAEGIAVQPLPDIGVAAESLDMGVEALSLDPSALGKPPPDNFSAEGLKSRNPFAKLFKAKLFKRADVVLVLLLVGSMVGLLINTQSHKNKQAAVSSVITQYGTQHIPLNGFVVETQGGINFAPSDVTINGALNVSAGLVLTPSVQPNTPTAGQLYYDHNTNQLAYYNGTGFVALTQQGAIVQNIGGATGAITLGGGLSVVNNQLTAALPSGVSSVGGISGAVTIGTGLKVVGSDIQNSGLLSIVPGTPNLVVGSDGNGNVTISSVGGGSGTVTSSGGTVGRIGKFTGVQNVENSLLSDDGTTVTANGNLSVTGSLLLSTVLPVASGGTGVASLPADSVVIGQGASALAGVVAPSAGLCLISTAGAPSFQSCSGTTGVSSVNGLTGNLTISNATGSVNTITIDDASTIAKGIASFNGTNFTVTGGAVNTAQNITTSSTPTFAGVNTNNVTPSSALTIGVATQSLSLLGSASSVFSVTGGGQTTNVGFAGVPAGSVNYNFDRSAAAGTYNICTTAANCSGIGGSVTTSGGTTNRLSKFTGGQVIGDSSISDNGSVVTVNGTANLVVQGGTATLGTLSQAGSLVLSDGASHTVTIMTSGLSADRVYTLPDAGGNATLCVNSGNCIGGTGAAPNAAEYLVASLNGTLTNERALAGGSNISLTDGGANATMTVATVQNPTFTTSVTTPILQSSGALTITSAAGTTVAIDAGTTIELQDSTNVTGSLDVSAAFTSGTANAFQVNAAGAIAAATGITSSGTITFSGLNCTGNLNGGALTTNASGQLMCSDDDGGSASAITGSGSSGTVPLFNGAQTITNSIITQSGTTITIAGDLTLNTALSVANGGTGATSLTARGLLYGNGAGAVQVTSAGTGGQVLIANGSGVPVFASFSGDVAVSNTGATTIQPDSVALGTDTTGSYVANLGLLTGLSASGNSGEGSTPTLSVTYGAIANTAVQGNVTLTCPSGAGNLTGGGNGVTLGAGGSCNNINIVNNPSFTTSVTTPAMILTGAGSNGTIQVANLGQGTVYTLPDPGGAAATICISTGNCSAAGSAGGDLTGSYPNPAIAKLQGTNLTITSPAAGHVLVYNATNSAWENHAIIGDIAISETGVSTVQANAVALGTDTTGNYVLGLTAGNGVNITGSAGEGWSPTVAVIYGNSANTAVQGNTSISVSAGTNLTGGGSITLGAGGAVTLNVASSPTFSGTLAVQGATATIGTSSQQGSVVLNDGSSNTATVQTAALAQNTTYTLPDPGGATATICLTTGNCSGAGGGVTTGGGTTNRVSKFTGSQTLGDSSISDNGSVVTINGTANFVVQGGTGTFGTLTQAGTLAVSDGSSNTVSVVAAGLAADRIYTLPDAGSNATFCLDTGNCIGSGGGGAPNNATYLLTSLNGTLSNERALANGSNIAFTDAGANGNFTVATVQNPTFTTSVTTPILQSSGALTITSAAGTTVAISAGTTIELQNSTNVTGSLDVSASFTSGTSDAFQVSSGGAITAVTGITSSGTVTFSGLNCTTFTNGGALTTNASGQLQCSNDDGGAGGAVSGSGTSGTIPVFTGTNTIADSIVTQASTTITIAGDLVLSTALSVANGGTGATSFTSHSLLYGNGTGVVQVTNVGTGGQVLIANASGIPTFASFSGDVAVSNTGVTTIQADSVALGTDTVGNYVSLLGTLTGLTTTGNTGEGSTPTLAVTYGSGANTAVQGNTSLTCASGTGNLSGGGNAVTLGSGGSCNNLTISNSPTFSTSVTTPSMILTGAGSNGILQIANLGQATTYTLPDPGGATATICLTTGNCTAIGAAGGDLTGSYPNPTIAKLQSGTLTISSVASGNLLQYNGSAWVNQSISGDITLNSSAVATIGTGKVNSGNILDNTIVNTDLASGSFGNITGVGTLGALTVTGAANINSAGSANTAIGNATGTFQVASNGLNVSAGGALTGVAGITTSGGYTQSGAVANTLTGATSLTAAGTALSVTNNATISGTLTTNTISPNSALTVGDAGQSFTLQGNGTSTIKSTDTGNTTILDFTTPIANTTLHLPALGTGAYTLCTSSGNCGGVGATLQTAYTNSTNPEIVLDATRGALTVRDTSGGLGANLLEVQNNTGSTTYFNVTAAGINTTGTNVSSGNVNTTGGTIQTNSTDRISNGGNLVNIGTITTTGAINTQTISSAANFTGTVTIQGTNALTLGTASTNTGAIIFKGSGGAGVLTLTGPATPNAGNFSLSIPAITANANLCTDNSICAGYAPSSGSANYANAALSNLASVAINAALGFQANQAANINFAAAAATTGNTLNITGQTAGGAANNGGDVTVQGGTGTTTGTGGTTAVRGGNAAATGTNGTLTLDAGTGATVANGTINIGAANASTINVGTNNTLTSTIQIGAAAQSAGTQTVNVGNSNTAGGTTIVVIGSGSSAAGGTTTVRAKGALTVTGGAASTWDVNGILSLQTTNNGAITTGTGLWTQGGNLTFNGTTARTITGPGTGGLTVTVAAGPLALSTTGSGTLAVTSAGALNLTGAAASTLNVGANTFALTSSNVNVTAGGVLTTTSAVLQGTNALTLGTASTNTGAIIFKGSGGAGTLTVAGPAIPNAGNFTLTIPAITANANVCTDNSVCAGYAPSSGSGSYANTALSNLASVAINAALGFQSNQTATINFNGTAAAGNALNITGQTATGGNGGNIAVTGGTGVGGGNLGGSVTIQGGNAGATGINGSVTVDTGSGATTSNGTVSIGTTNANTVTIGNTANNTIVNIQAGNGFTTSTGQINIGTTSKSTIAIGSTSTAGNSVSIESGSTNSIAIGNSGTTHTILIGVNSSAGSTNTITLGNFDNVASSTAIRGGNDATSAITLTPYTTGGITIGAAAGTGQIILGSSSAAQSVVIANGAGAATVNIANSATAGSTVSVLGAATATGNTDTLNLATGNTAGTGSKVVHIADGTPAGTGTSTVTIGSLGNASTTTIQGGTGGVIVGVSGASTAASTVHIADTSNGTGTQTVTVGSNAKSANVLTLEAGTAVAALQIGNGATAHGIQIGSSASGDNDILLGSSNSASTLIMEGGTAASAIQIGNGATAHGIQVGTGAAVNSIIIGSTNTTSATTVQAGSGGISLTANGATAGVLVKGSTNSSAAFQLQNSSGDILFNATTVAKTDLLTNPGFETNTTAPWVTANGGTVALSRVTTQSYANTASMQVAISTATQWAGAKYPVSLTSGQSYTFSFYVKSSSGVTNIDAGYSNTGAFAGEVDCVTNFPTIYTTGWTRVSCTFTAGAPSGSPYVYIEIPTATISTFWVDNVQLTQTTTDNGAYYAGQVDMSSTALSQLAIQPAGDSTNALQVFSAGGTPVMQVDTINKQVMATQFLITDNFTDPTKGVRFRTNGSGIDLETAGGIGPGSLWLTGWSGTGGAFGTGTQYTFLRSDPTLNQPVVTLGAGFGSATPTITVLDTKNTAGDPAYGTNGAMYYNGSSNAFRCYQSGAWANCSGITTSDTFRQQPFYSTDFFAVDNTPANAGYSTQEAPWLGAWANAAGQMGAIQAGVANHPGIVRMSSAGVANTGWMFETGVSSILLSGGESFEAVFRTPASFSNTTIRMGFLDTITVAAPSDGVYVEFAPGTTTTSVTGKTANGGTISSTGTTGTVSVSTFYRMKVTLNGNASTATYTLYIDGTNTVLWTNTLSTNIPTTAGHETASGVIATNSVGAAALLDMDYMAMWLSQAMAR